MHPTLKVEDCFCLHIQSKPDQQSFSPSRNWGSTQPELPKSTDTNHTAVQQLLFFPSCAGSQNIPHLYSNPVQQIEE